MYTVGLESHQIKWLPGSDVCLFVPLSLWRQRLVRTPPIIVLRKKNLIVAVCTIVHNCFGNIFVKLPRISNTCRTAIAHNTEALFVQKLRQTTAINQNMLWKQKMVGSKYLTTSLLPIQTMENVCNFVSNERVVDHHIYYQPASIFNLLLWNSHVRNYEHVQWKALKEICWWCCWQNLFSRYLVTTPDPGARLVFTHGCTCSVHILIQNVLWLE